jgi:hypothetical protein
MDERRETVHPGDLALPGDAAGGAGRVLIRGATRADIEKFFPEYTAVSFRAWVGEVDGVARGIAGIAYTRPYPTLFSNFEEEYRAHLESFAVRRLILKLGQIVRAEPVTVLAFSDPDEEKSPALLQKLGFSPIDGLGEIGLWGA